jgi:hypothetical protein
VAALFEGRCPVGVSHFNAGDLATVVTNARHRRTKARLGATLGEPIAAAFPHHPRAEAWIVKRVDEAGDDLRSAESRAEQGIPHGLEQVEVLDPLRGPIGPDLRTWHAPHFFGVGAEEDLKQTAAEATAHPFFHVAILAGRLQAGAEIREDDPRRLNRAEPPKSIARPQRVVEESGPVVNAGQAWTLEQVRPEYLLPDALDKGDLREEAMPPNVVSEALVSTGTRNAADGVVRLEHGGRDTEAIQLPRRRQSGRPRADDQHTPADTA